jgi:hypothetical protein
MARRAIAALGVAAVLQVLLSGDLWPVPFRNDGAAVHGLPLLVFGWAVVAGFLCVPAAPAVEQVLPQRRLRLFRLTWALTLLAGTVAASTLCISVADAGSVAVGVRNTVMLVGLALLTGTVVGAELAWLAPLVVFALTFFLGVDDSLRPRWWALPLQPPDDGGALVAAAACAAAAVAAYTLLDMGGVVGGPS